MSIGSWFRKLVGSKPAQTEATEPAPPSKPPLPATPTIHPLSLVGLPEGPAEAQALSLLEQAAGTPEERVALAALTTAIAQRDIPDSLSSRCALLLVERGDREGALRVLESTSRPSDLLLRADLLTEIGKPAQALSLLERLLARDIDFPGAKERHERLRVRLKPQAGSARGKSDVTIAVPSQQQVPFRILREVARGGSGTIYEAQDEALGRPVAYKVYHRAEADRAQIEREARLAIRLRGPGVIRVYDASFDQGWLALEWIACGSLRDWLQEGRAQELVPLGPWAKRLAQAIARVHEAGLVHADIKPSNVLLRSAQEPVLCDFGIAVSEGEASLGGSAGYLSPERLEGKSLTASDDVYAFGRILEDVLLKVEDRQLNKIAKLCLLAAGERPGSGRELVERLE